MARPNTYEKNAFEILEKNEKARNNDGTLYAHYLKEYVHEFIRKDENGDEYVRLKDLQHIWCKANPYNVIRTRQKIQSPDGLFKFLPTLPSIRKARKISEHDWYNYSLN